MTGDQALYGHSKQGKIIKLLDKHRDSKPAPFSENKAIDSLNVLFEPDNKHSDLNELYTLESNSHQKLDPTFHIMTICKFQPPSLSHRTLIDKVTSVANRKGADYSILVSSKTDDKNNPLGVYLKMQYLRAFFPTVKFKVLKDEPDSLTEFFAKLKDKGVKHVQWVQGRNATKNEQYYQSIKQVQEKINIRITPDIIDNSIGTSHAVRQAAIQLDLLNSYYGFQLKRPDENYK
jgi:hypothetical protein